jgi:hypothetical protein
MNETRRPASAGVQRAPAKVTDMINEPGHPTGSLVISVERGHPMLKTISAALLAVSVLAAPAIAGTLKTTHTSTHAPAVKSAHIKASVLNAHAHMGRHHHHHYRHFRHHRFHKR